MTHTPQYYRYWGKAKAEPEAGQPAYHLLPYHSLDVAAVGYCLLDPGRPLVRQLAAQLQVDPKWLQTWLVFCLAIHDLGKFASAFQGQKTGLSAELIKAKANMSYTERHDSLGFCIWDVLHAKLPVVFSGSNGLAIARQYQEPWLEIVTGHHGTPPKKRIRTQNFFTVEDEEAALAFIKDAAALLLADFDFQPLQDKQLNSRLKSVSWQLAGVAVLADWQGSNQDYFAYCNQVQELAIYWRDIALINAQNAIAAVPKAPKINAFQSVSDLFKFIRQATPLQSYAAAEPLSKQAQLFILEDVTGAGKTEAALVLAQRLMSQGLADGLYIALPTMATANAMYHRLGLVYRQFYLAESQPSLILAHGARQMSEAFQQSVVIAEHAKSDDDYQSGHLEEAQELSATAYCNVWLADSRKKALLADVGVGTLDQALLAVLPARHQSLRLLGLRRKVLLVDEVHAYDSYMQKLLDALLEAHARQGGCAILLSATLPQAMREALVAAFHRGLDQQMPVLDKQAKYPLATHAPAAQVEQVIDTRPEVKRTVKIQRLNSEDEVISRILKTIAKDQCVCWIRNTVKSARLAYQKLLDAGVSTEQLSLFHSRFAMIDRQVIENQTLAMFGKESTHEQRRGQILIATQVVEQSLDLDFDVLITDLAPIDLIIQRAGRLRRHCRDAQGNRLQGEQDQRGEPVLYIYTPEPNQNVDGNWLRPDHAGTQAVYPHIGQLWLTAKCLLERGQFTMPEDARDLIEQVYAIDAIYPEALEFGSFTAEGADKSRESMADLNALKLNKGYTRSSGDWDEETKIPTRLSEQESVSVALAVIDSGKLKPYAKADRYAWALSTVKLPESEWKQAQRHISANLKDLIENLKVEEKAVRWLEILLLVEGQMIYSAQQGFLGVIPASAGNA